MVDIITRSQWGARLPKHQTPMTLPTSKLILHHSASPSGGAERIRQIQNFHMDTRGWNDIAYHYLINRGGIIYEGRHVNVQGGATSGHNRDSHAICILGNYNDEVPTLQAIDSLIGLIQSQDVWPSTITGGHKDYTSTSCPGSSLYALIPDINHELEKDVTPDEFRAILTEFFDVREKTDHTGDVYRHSWLVGNSTWRSEVGRGTAREFLSSVLVQARNFARDDFLNGDGVLELSDQDLDAIAEAVADEQARRLVD